MTKTRIASYEVVDHGIENSQYFQGCGVCFTSYTDVVTGIGNDFAEALEDALESAAQNGVDVDDIEAEIKHDMGEYPTDSVPEDAEDCYYYVSLRYTLES